MRLTPFLGFLLALLTACGGGGGGPIDTPPPEQEADVLFVETSQPARVVLPEGAAWAPQDLILETALGEAAVGSDGTAQVPIWTGGPQLVQARDPAGDTALMGWIGGGFDEISPRSTAQVLLHFASGAYSVLPELALDALKMSASHPAADGLASAVQAQVANGAPNLGAILDATESQLRDAAQNLKANDPAAGNQKTFFQPGEGQAQSGVQLQGDGFAAIRLVNNYRRRAAAFVRPTSYVPQGGGSAIDVDQPAAQHDLDPSNGFRSLLGLAWDFVVGKGVYQKTTSDPIPTPIAPALSRRTTYEVLVAGPGSSRGEHYDKLNAGQRLVLVELWAQTAIFDMAIPMILKVIIPVGYDQIRAIALDPEIIKEVLKAVKLIAKVPSLTEKLEQGDFAGYLLEAAKIVIEGEFKTPIYNAIRGAISRNAHRIGAKSLANLAEGVLVLKAIDAVGASVDTIIQGSHIAKSNWVDRWEVHVENPKVELSPKEGRIVIGEPGSNGLVDLKATVDSPPTAGAHYRFVWTSSGNAGLVSSALQGPALQVETDSEYAAYSATLRNPGYDTVTVEVYEVDAAGTRALVGADQAQMRVVDLEPVLTPKVVSVAPGTSFSGFNVEFEDGVPVPEDLAFRWSSSESHGVVTSPQLDELTRVGTAAYRADDNANTPATERLRVSVYAVENGLLRHLGDAESEIRIEDRLSRIPTAYKIDVQTPFPEDPAQHTVYAIVPFQPPADARRMTLIGDGVDPDYYTNGVRVTAVKRSDGTWDLRGHHYPFGEPAWVVSGAAGSASHVPQFTSWLKGRFDSFKWHIEVEYED